MTFPKISRQFFDYFPKLVDTLPNFVDTFLKKQTFILNQLTVSIDSLSIFVVEDRMHFLHFFCRKNLEKVKCSSYLCTVFRNTFTHDSFTTRLALFLHDGSFVIYKKPPKKRRKHGQAKNLQDRDNGSDRSPQLSGDSLGFELL